VGRGLSEDFLTWLGQQSDYKLGVRLAKLCIKANLRASHVTKALKVEGSTVHKWWRGQTAIGKKYVARVEVFMELVEEDLENKRLPATNYADSRQYIQELVGDTT
jgi:hypothetical protein